MLVGVLGREQAMCEVRRGDPHLTSWMRVRWGSSPLLTHAVPQQHLWPTRRGPPRCAPPPHPHPHPQELLEVEPDAKWPLLTLTRLRELRLLVEGQGQAAPAAAAPAAEVAEGYRRLAELDPLRAGYYRDAAEGRAHVVARPTAGMALPR